MECGAGAIDTGAQEVAPEDFQFTVRSGWPGLPTKRPEAVPLNAGTSEVRRRQVCAQ